MITDESLKMLVTKNMPHADWDETQDFKKDCQKMFAKQKVCTFDNVFRI